jgi:aerobic C4-dicarboxylate transport protein
MSEARALTNLIGNNVATLVVARRLGDLDLEQLHRQLDRRDDEPLDDVAPPAPVRTAELKPFRRP